MTNLYVKESFSYWTANPEDTMASDIVHLEDATKAFPYCQVLHLLLAKAVNLHEPERTAEVIHKAAAYSLSRKALRKLILKEFEWSDNLLMRQLTSGLSDYRKESYTTFKTKPFDLPDLSEMAHVDFETMGIDFENIIDTTTLRENNLQQELALLKGKTEKQVELDRQLQMEIIDSYIENEIKLSPIRANLNDQTQQEDLVKKRNIDNAPSSIISEGMAKLLARQGKIEKAVEMYEQLIMKRPEKKSYFEEKIKELTNQ